MTEIIDRAVSHPAGSPVDLLVALFLLGMLPLLAVSVTSFTRIIVVLGLLRASLGASSLPPNIVLAGLAMMLTCVVMAPTFARVQQAAIEPLGAKRIAPAQAIARGAAPLRSFMLAQSRASDVESFERMERSKQTRVADAPFTAVAPAFLIGELRAAFAMGFALALPFAVVDIVVAAVLMSLGMYMVSPAAISLPIKLLLFVVADGWALVAGALVASYR
ncbi:MAG TPA: flagellar type III secretion system pore protein FliP [Candidatus Eremiobacteraceae bacterium]|nr:flagellar type III secretion system pore protein FliP [Candidatus Eremiobacteraceae bacterium]